MAYSELIKNFEKVRAYMQDFYIYGFKTRNEYDQKSARSYDDERRRIESWLGEYVHSAMTQDGKNLFLSIDSRQHQRNPLFKAWKSKSFTDGDIILHFLLMDILQCAEEPMSLVQIIEELDDYLFETDGYLAFDESTIRKKLQEYTRLGIVTAQKQGRQMRYSRVPDTDISSLRDALDFFSETAPCGVIGSFLLDKLPEKSGLFYFKHHYITQTMDSGILAALFDAIQEKRFVTVQSFSQFLDGQHAVRIIPMKIYISAQNGRQYLLGYHGNTLHLITFRLDRLSKVRQEEVCEQFDVLRQQLRQTEQHMWGVSLPQQPRPLEHVEFDISVGPGESHIPLRLEREKRCGTVEKLDEAHYRYCADVYDTVEMIPWIRTYLCRITRLELSNKKAEARFLWDLHRMYRMYGLEGENTL